MQLGVRVCVVQYCEARLVPVRYGCTFSFEVSPRAPVQQPAQRAARARRAKRLPDESLFSVSFLLEVAVGRMALNVPYPLPSTFEKASV